MKFVNSGLLLIFLSVLFSCNKSDVAPEIQIDVPDGYSLVWQDEFNQAAINSDKWIYEVGNGTDYGLPAGWGNNEKQIYTDSEDNSYIEKDNEVSSLIITAREDGTGGYTSAKLVTKELLSMRFGRIDIRAKMPEGQGLLPAIWMLGDNIDLIGWPGCGEIDIAEVLGHEPSTLYSTLHFTNSEKKHEEIQNIHELSSGSFSNDYHIFSLDWSPEFLTFRLDDIQLNQVPIDDDMKEFLRSFYLILNVAVGGYWPGEPDNTTVFPQSMAVDYVRVFSKDDLAPSEPPVLDYDAETVGQYIDPNLAHSAIREGFTDLGNLSVVAYGGGGEPEIATSETAIDGSLSLSFAYPGGNWGGAYIELSDAKDMSSYSYLKFSLNKPATFVNAEIKLESSGTNAVVFLEDYAGTDVANGFVEYTISLSDFTGLDVTALTIPFSIWNPQDANQNFVNATVLIDNIYFSN